METKYVVTLHIRSTEDGREAVLQFDDDKIAPITDKDGSVLGQFRLVPEGLPSLAAPRSVDDASQCLKYCLYEDHNSLPYCVALCATTAP